MVTNEHRRETRITPQYGVITVCEPDPMFIGVVLDISVAGLGIKSYKKPANNQYKRIRLMGPGGIRIDDIPMKIIYVSKTPFVPANTGQDDDHFYRMGVRLTPEKEQADKIHELIAMTSSDKVSICDSMQRKS